MGTHSSSRRRGASLAACAFGLTLALSGVQPIAAQHTLPVAHAAPRTTVHWDTLRPAFGESATAPASVRALGLFGRPAEPTSWALSEGFEAPEGWSIELDDAGAITAQPPTPFTEDAVDEFDVPVQVTFSDGTSSEFSAHVELADEPYLIAPGDKTYWSGRLILPLYLRAVNVPLGSKLELDGLPDGLWTTLQAPGLKRSQYFYVNGRPEGTGEYPVTLRVVDRHGEPVENAAGPLETEFTITFRDPADLEPLEADLADSPAEPVAAGEPIRIPISADNAASVEVSGLPDGVEFNGEDSVIEGTPEEPGTSSVTVDLITDDGERLVDTFDLVVAGETSAETSAQAETSAPESADATAKNSAQAEESAESSAMTAGVTTAESSARAETSAPESAEPSAKNSAQAEESAEPSATTTGVTSAESSAQAETSAPESAEPTAKNSAQAETSALESAEPTAKNSAQAEESAEPSAMTAGVTNAKTSAQAETSALESAEPSAKNSAQAEESAEPSATTTGVTGVETSAQAESSAPESAEPTAKNSAQAETSALESAEPTAKNSAQAESSAEPTATAAGVTSVENSAQAEESEEPNATTVAEPTTKNSAQAEKPTAPVDPAGPEEIDQFEWDEFTVAAGAENAVDPVRSERSAVVTAEAGAPDWVTVFRGGQVYASPSRDVAPGEYPVKVRTSNGETDTIHVRVVEATNDAERYTPTYAVAYARAGGSVQSLPPRATFTVRSSEFDNQPLPEGTRFEVEGDGVSVDRHGAITYAPPLDAQVGKAKLVPVKVVYPDGSSEGTVARFEVLKARDAELYTPAYQAERAAGAGETATVAQTTRDLPAETEFSLEPAANLHGWDVRVDARTGRVEATAPETPADLDVNVHVSYADGSEETVPVHVAARRTASMAQSTELRYDDAYAAADGTITIAPRGTLPEGVAFAAASATPVQLDVEPSTGVITAKLPDGAPADTSYTLGVRAAFPDGSATQLSATVTTDSQARHADVRWPSVAVPVGADAVTAQVTGAPAGTTFALAAEYSGSPWPSSVDPTTGALTVAAPKGANAGDGAEVPVVVTFPDGSQRLMAVRATAVDAMAGAQPTEYGAAEVRPGDSVTVSPAFEAAKFSLVEKVEGLSMRIDATSGALTATATAHAAPGPRRVPVRVTFADSTQATAYATVTVLPADVTAQAQGEGEGASAVGKLVALALGILASTGAVGFGLYENREFFRTFLAFPLR
ncbi:Rib/alpha-like domain-containing protein [Corynebacterium gottingense]|uniref:Rib/alpha-like domain-containing protein n=1 Tax=Corynebacterium gottingense TaxID=2041036 RepID=UPI0039EFA498